MTPSPFRCGHHIWKLPDGTNPESFCCLSAVTIHSMSDFGCHCQSAAGIERRTRGKINSPSPLSLSLIHSLYVGRARIFRMYFCGVKSSLDYYCHLCHCLSFFSLRDWESMYALSHLCLGFLWLHRHWHFFRWFIVLRRPRWQNWVNRGWASERVRERIGEG